MKNKKTTIPIAIIILISTFAYLRYLGNGWLSINKKTETTEVKEIKPDTVAVNSQQNTKEAAPEVAKSIPAIQFKETGQSIDDFVPASYKIVLDAGGLLDDDSLEDAVIVLQNKKDKMDLRATLVLLKQPDGGYKLHGVSWKAIGPAYLEGNYKQYDEEALSIDSGMIKLATISLGPAGSIESSYRFINNQLVLTKLNAHSIGAGSQVSMNIDLVKDAFTIEVINTMEEDPPTDISTKKIPAHKPYLFETTEPRSLVAEIYQRS